MVKPSRHYGSHGAYIQAATRRYLVISKLLIADDHAPTRQWLRSRLSEFAGEIHECADGADAVRQFSAHQHDWVLMDVEMLPMNGLTATDLIRKEWPEARIVVVSSHNEPWMREAAMAAGAHSFVQKDDLWRIVEILEGVGSPTAGSSLNV
ncbi:MAG TPA: response regulator transcription factor [Methylomirabilota bacterium]|nr:response regulator transcription factor [Methylomirabilota bacterium]